jgi:hypothetical protein
MVIERMRKKQEVSLSMDGYPKIVKEKNQKIASVPVGTCLKIAFFGV